jgi:hypothetical protein
MRSIRLNIFNSRKALPFLPVLRCYIVHIHFDFWSRDDSNIKVSRFDPTIGDRVISRVYLAKSLQTISQRDQTISRRFPLF